jgi:hypothetical protein
MARKDARLRNIAQMMWRYALAGDLDVWWQLLISVNIIAQLSPWVWSEMRPGE